MLNGKLKGSLEYFFQDENFGGNLWNSHPYLVWENSKFETETSKLGGHSPSVLAIKAFKLVLSHPIRYKFDQTDREVFESALEAALSSGDILELKSTQDIDKYADFIVTAISTAVDKAIPTTKSGRPESQPVSDEPVSDVGLGGSTLRHMTRW